MGMAMIVWSVVDFVELFFLHFFLHSYSKPEWSMNEICCTKILISSTNSSGTAKVHAEHNVHYGNYLPFRKPWFYSEALQHHMQQPSSVTVSAGVREGERASLQPPDARSPGVDTRSIMSTVKDHITCYIHPEYRWAASTKSCQLLFYSLHLNIVLWGQMVRGAQHVHLIPCAPRWSITKSVTLQCELKKSPQAFHLHGIQILCPSIK